MNTDAITQERSNPALQSAWQDVVLQLKLQMDQNFFNAYIRDSEPVALVEDVLTIASPGAYASDWSNSRLKQIVSRLVSPLIGRPIRPQFVYIEAETPPVGQGEGELKEAEPLEEEAPAPALKAVHEAALEEEDSAIAAGICNGQLEEDAAPLPVAAAEDAAVDPVLEIDPEDDGCRDVQLENVADSIEAALQRPGRIVAFPRYELRFIPLVGPENFFLRLAFLQERFFHTGEDGRGRPFETSVEELLRWAQVGRATLHRFKKGDASRGQPAAAGWFGIEQLPSAPRTAASQQQPPCRYRVQMGIPLTPMDADRLRDQLIAAGIAQNPLQALQVVCDRPIQEILEFPPPAPSEEQRRRAPVFTTVSQVVQAALGSARVDADTRAKISEWTVRLNDHITMPHQMVHVSWYFLREWLPLLGHDAAALVLYTRAQGYYNPQTQELRDEVTISGGYSELARVIGLKRDRTIGDWLPNIFDSKPRRGTVPTTGAEASEDKWQREQQRQQQAQARIGQFVQVVPGSRAKTADGHYAFNLHVEIKGEPLTSTDLALRDWVQRTLSACAEAQVLEHFLAWVQSEACQQKAQLCALEQNDGAGMLGAGLDAKKAASQNDGWGILAARQEERQKHAPGKMTARESAPLDSDGWGILERILNDGWGILAPLEMTARELFKGLLRLNTYWETILQQLKTTSAGEHNQRVVVESWDLHRICQRNGGMNRYREQILEENDSPAQFLSWLFYAYSFKGKGINDPIGWALARMKEQPDSPAEGVYQRLAALPPDRIGHLLRRHIDNGLAPADGDWALAFRDTPLPRLGELAETLGLSR